MSDSRLKPYFERLDSLVEEDFSHDEAYGTQNGFHEVNEVKNEIANFLLNILRDLDSCVDKLPQGIVDRELKKLEQQLKKLETYKIQIDQASKLQTTDQKFVQLRNSVHQTSKVHSTQYGDELLDLQLAIQIAQASSALAGLNLADQTAESHALLVSLRESRDKAEGIVATVRDSAAAETYNESQSSYSTLSAGHSRREWSWFAAAAVALVGLFGAVGYIIFGVYSASTTPEAILTVFRKGLLVGAPLLFLRICLTKYNAERHLRILYDHRNAALDQLRLLEAAIDDDLAAKAELRLEAAKMILSDPSTSYGSSSETSDINISPVFSALEKVANKNTGN